MKTYKYTNDKAYRFYEPTLKDVTFTYGSDYAPIFCCNNGYCIIYNGYAWDGCTLAPDFEQTKEASMAHDALYQFGKMLGLNRKIADKWFRKLLIKNNFKYTNLYYYAVRLFGWLYY